MVYFISTFLLQLQKWTMTVFDVAVWPDSINGEQMLRMGLTRCYWSLLGCRIMNILIALYTHRILMWCFENLYDNTTTCYMYMFAAYFHSLYYSQTHNMVLYKNTTIHFTRIKKIIITNNVSKRIWRYQIKALLICWWVGGDYHPIKDFYLDKVKFRRSS